MVEGLKQKMKRLYEKKLMIQNLEMSLEIKKKKWAELGTQIRSDAQQVYELKEELLDEI